jgi:pimeloyl-ACP methyl ester carboxylesterase
MKLVRFGVVVAILAWCVGITSSAQAVSERITIDGATIEISRWGSGEIIVIPGLGASASYFDFLGPELAARGFQPIAMNPRGIRGSSGELSRLTLADYAADVVCLLDALKLSRVHLLGWAFGNRIARMTASEHPSRVSSVILLAAGGRVPGDPVAIEAMNVLSDPNLSRERVAELAKVALLGPNSEAGRYLQVRDQWPDARRAQTAAGAATPIERWWSGGAARMLVVQGLDDRLAPPGNGRLLKQQFPDRVDLVEIPNAGHGLLLEVPGQIADAISTFVGQLRR